MADAVAAQMRRLEAYSTFGDFGNRPANELSERLAALAPMDEARVFLTSGGGDAIDTAAKIARRHFIQPGPAGARAPDQPHPGLPRHARLRHQHRRHRGQHEQLGPAGPADLLGRRSTRCLRWRPRSPASARSKVAAFFCEPVIGAGGVHPPPEGYIEGVADLCAEHGILLVVDSVICALRPARHVVRDRALAGRRPDMITFAKGVTSGYLPLGGVVVSRRGGRAVLRGRAGRCSATARPTPATRAAARPRSRCSTSTSATA